MKSSEKLKYWQDHMTKATAFPGSNARYCLEAGISKNLFGYWKTRLKQSRPRDQDGQKVSISKFVPVEIYSSPVTSKGHLPDAKWVAEFLIHFMGGVK